MPIILLVILLLLTSQITVADESKHNKFWTDKDIIEMCKNSFSKQKISKSTKQCSKILKKYSQICSNKARAHLPKFDGNTSDNEFSDYENLISLHKYCVFGHLYLYGP